MAKRFKRTKGVDITGKWIVDENDNIIRYKSISVDTKCSYCQGLNKDCPICHGKSMDVQVSYSSNKIVLWLYNLVKKLIKRLRKK